MKSSDFVPALKSGRRLYGTLIVSDSPRWPDTVSRMGLDFVFIDTEHIAIDRKPLSWMCQTYRALGLPPIVRIPSPDPFAATMVLDGGAAGIIAPYVETPEQIRALRGAVKLRPIKGARLERTLAGHACEPELAKYQLERHGGNALIINVESVPALERLDELLAEPGLDGVLIGPHDLSCSLGIPEQYDHPRFEEAVRTIFRKARARGVAAGIHAWVGIDRFVPWAEAGLNLIIYSADILAMRDKISGDIAQLKGKLGDAKSGPAGVDNI